MTRRNTLQHPLLTSCGVIHGFGVRDAPPPPLRLLRPRQVHGSAVAELLEEAPARDGCQAPDHALGNGCLAPVEADAVVSTRADLAVGVVTADCVPILAAAVSGTAVAAIHAGWRGLAAGVIEAGLAALRSHCSAGESIRAVIGPHIGACCYEVDDAVLLPLRDRFPSQLDAALFATRPGHARLDLGRLARAELSRLGVAAGDLGGLLDDCTACHPESFFSYRRDGARAGRLLHYIAAR